MSDKIFEIAPINYREMRARALSAEIMQKLRRYIPDALLSRAHDDLMGLFVEADAEVITKADRQRANLPERNPLGLSPDEHRVIEAQKTLALVSPPAPLYFCARCEKDLGPIEEAGKNV